MGQPEHEHRNKTPKQNISKLNPETFKKNYTSQRS